MTEESAPEAVSSPGRVRVSLPDHYKPVDDGVWEDLESYLYQGFLTSPAYLVGRTFVFKTLNHHELRYVRYLRPMRTSASEALDLHRAAFIAHSVFMIDGKNLLPRRHDQAARLVRIVQKMPVSVQETIVSNLASLNSKASRLHPLTEVFVHESRSRFRWMHTGGPPVHSPVHTGVAGTDEIGMNYCQQAWTSLNRLLDTRESMERDWTNAKFVGSCFAGKSVRAVDERDKARASREKADLEDLKMKVLHGYMNRTPGKESKQEVTLPDGRKAVVVSRFRVESAQELADQMSAALSGEKDHHDLVVEMQMQRVMERAKSMDDSRQRIYRAPASAEGVPISGSSRVLGGKEEAEAILARLKNLQHEQLVRHHRSKIGSEDAESSDGPRGPETDE